MVMEAGKSKISCVDEQSQHPELLTMQVKSEFFQKWKCSEARWLHNNMHVLDTTKLYT